MSFEELYQRMVQGLAALDNDEIKQTIHDEACVNLKSKSGDEKEKVFLLEKNPQKDEVTEIQQFLSAWLANDEIKNAIKDSLDKGSTFKIKKGTRFPAPNGGFLKLPRSIRFIKLENGEIGVIINTKSKIAILENPDPDIHSLKEGKINRLQFPKPAGASKHGTAAVLLWPRDLNKNTLGKYPQNPLLWNGVEKYTEENINKAIKEAEISQQNHPFIQSILIDKVPVDQKINTFGWASPTGTLKDKLNNLDETQKMTVASSFLLAMLHLHHQNPPILHRDLKPEQLLLFEENGKLISKLTDFEFSTLPLDQAVGTPQYLSPSVLSHHEYLREMMAMPCVQLYGKQAPPQIRYQASKEDDIWAIGCILYQIFCDPQFTNFSEVLKSLEGKPEPPEGAPLIDVMKYIMEKCLKKEPSARFTMDQIIQQLPDQQLVAELKKMVEDKRKAAVSPPTMAPITASPVAGPLARSTATTASLPPASIYVGTQAELLPRYRRLEREFMKNPSPEKLRTLAKFPLDNCQARELESIISKCLENSAYWSYETMTAALNMQYENDPKAKEAALKKAFEDLIKNQYFKSPSVDSLSCLVSFLKNNFTVSPKEQEEIFKIGMDLFENGKLMGQDPGRMKENFQDMLFLAEAFNKKADPIHKIAKDLNLTLQTPPGAPPIPQKPQPMTHPQPLTYGYVRSPPDKTKVAPTNTPEPLNKSISFKKS